jgi:hypothetical protein
MSTLVTLILWLMLAVFSLPLALLVLVLWPLVWLLSLPFRLIGLSFEAVFALLRAILMLPARLLGGGQGVVQVNDAPLREARERKGFGMKAAQHALRFTAFQEPEEPPPDACGEFGPVARNEAVNRCRIPQHQARFELEQLLLIKPQLTGHLKKAAWKGIRSPLREHRKQAVELRSARDLQPIGGEDVGIGPVVALHKGEAL